MSGFGVLLTQRLRRDWRQLLIWIVGIVLLAYLAYTAVAQSYGTEQDRISLLAAAIANPVILVFRGLPSGTEEGAFIFFLIFPWLAFLAALMNTFFAVRHTRNDEELGRAELVAATPAGRTTPLIATIVFGLFADIILAVLVALAFIATGLGAVGSVIAGAATGAVGVTFLGVGLLAAQLMRTSRGANSLAVWIVVAALLVSGIGNAIGTPSDDLQRMESSSLTWLSPFGWGENTRPFTENAWWPIALCVGLGLLLAAVSVALQSQRDLGDSFVAERRGRAAARSWLSTSPALVWRLTWGGILGWSIGGLVTGVMSTSLASVVDQIGSENPAVQKVLEAISGDADVARGTVTVFFTMLGVLAACAAVQVVIRARQEEAHGTAEPVLAAAVARVRWLAGYLIVAFAAIVLVAVAAGVGAALGIASQGGDWWLMGDVAVTGGGQVVAAGVFAVLTALVFVLLPRWTIGVGWGLVALGTILGLFGPLFGFPDWLVKLAPIGVAPQATADGVDVKGLWWLLLAVAVGAAVSLILMRRRELAADG